MRTISKQGLVTILCILMIMFTSIGLAKAYFSDYTEASGQAVLTLTTETYMDENVDPDGTKHITVKNTGKTDVVVRVNVYGPWLTDEDQAKDISGEGWEYKDGYYYYTKVIAPGDETAELVVKLDNIDDADGRIENFDITAKFQAAIVTYNNGSIATPEGWEYLPEISE